MTTIYRKPGAVHGFSVEFYRVHKGEVEYCDTHGQWVPARMTRLDIREHLESGSLTVVPWVYYHSSFEDWNYRFAGPFSQALAGSYWRPSLVRSEEVPELVERGVLRRVEPIDIPA